MKRQHLVSFGLVMVIALAMACGGGGGGAPTPSAPQTTAPAPSGGTTTPATTRAPASTASSPDSGSKVDTIHLVLTGGAHAGTYDLKSDGSFDNKICIREGAGNINFLFADPLSEDPKKPNQVSAIVMPLKSASKTADEFQIWVDFPSGNFQIPVTKYEVADLPSHGQAKKGTGTFTVDDKGGTASMTFKGTTPDNVTIDAAIECKQVSK